MAESVVESGVVDDGRVDPLLQTPVLFAHSMSCSTAVGVCVSVYDILSLPSPPFSFLNIKLKMETSNEKMEKERESK